jgi:Na+-driven multidrug efflux pump
MNKAIAFGLMLVLAATSMAQTDLEGALQTFCTQLYSYVGDMAFIMILLSAIVFAVGQFFGAEARARANVWANSMFIGALIGLIMVILVPWFLGLLLGSGMTFDASTCEFGA